MSEENGSKMWLGYIVKIIVVIVVLVIGFGAKKFLTENGPEATKEKPKKVIPTVKTIAVESGSKALTVKSHGRVIPTRKTQAASEVVGRVVMVSDSFKAGGSFVKGEILLEMDSADYVSALASTEAGLADAKLHLAQEEARAAQSARDWKKLGRGEPSDLVLRKPQVVSAKARIASAEAAVNKALRDLDRTKLRAPYDCLVEATYTDLGSYISPGMKLADLYSAGSYELRVPISLEDFTYLDSAEIIGSEVALTSSGTTEAISWKGQVIGNENIVDQETMTIYLVVGIEPETTRENHQLPAMGLFLDAEIAGKTMDNIVELPRNAIHENDTVYVMGEDSKLEIVNVKVARTLSNSVLVKEGLSDGMKIIVSPMEIAVSGMALSESN